MEYKGLTLDKFQEDAITAIDNNHSVVVSAPTGSGKTLIADYIINKDIKKDIRVIYTAPIKALSNQKYKEFSQAFGEENIGLLTGDVVINPMAPILIMTTEVYRNMALINDEIVDKISYVIFDEIHYINDIERGYIWEESIIFSKDHIRFLCLSATIPNAKEFARWIESIKKHTVEVINHDIRPVPLKRQFFDTELGITTLKDIKEISDIPDYKYVRGMKRTRKPRLAPPSHVELIEEIQDKLPCFFFDFSRKNCQKNAIELTDKKLFQRNPKIDAIIRKKLENVSPEINQLVSTRTLRKTLPYGIGFHHAGLLPITKELVEELFGQGLIKVLYTTETFAVGINMPAKSVCFKALRKYDGINFRNLNSKEYFQIAGRAGRRGIDKIGYSYAMIERRDFDYAAIKRITDKDVLPIKSQFRLSVNTVLNLIKQHDQEKINTILRMNFHTFQKYGNDYDKIKKGVVFNKFDSIKRKLEKLDFVKDNKLTEKGEFASQIYAFEIQLGEIFATDFFKDLNEYQLLILIAALCYEPRETTILHELYPDKPLHDLIKHIRKHYVLSRYKEFKHLEELTAFMHPCYHGKSIFDVMKNTNLLEGDIIRLFKQILDMIGQIKKATKEEGLVRMMDNIKDVILEAMKDIDII